MTLAWCPIQFKNATPLSPSKINSAWQKLAEDMVDFLKHRFTYSTFTVEFTGITDTSTSNEKTCTVKPPFSWEMIGAELISYGAANVSALSVTGTPSTLSLTTITGTRVVASTNLRKASAASVETTFTLAITSTGAYTLGKTYLNVQVKQDRGSVSFSTYGMNNTPRFASGELVAAAKMNTAFTNYQTASTASALASNGFSMQIYMRRNVAAAIPAYLQVLRLPAIKRTLHSFDVVNLAAATNNLTATITNQAGATVGSAVTVNGAGVNTIAKTQGTTLGPTQQSGTDPTNSANDFKLTLTRAGAGTIQMGYVVIYFTG